MSLKRLLIGKPIESAREQHERLNKVMGLAVLSSDAVSSVAYGTEEILIALMLFGPTLMRFSMPIGIAISALIIVVTISYFQTVHAYPSGGGAYIVGKDNLGEYAGLIAGAALLMDYILTVAVSITAGIAAITSAFPVLYEHKVALSLISIGLLLLGNLRGVRESGKLFSIPPYIFIFSMYALIMFGLVKFFGLPHPVYQKYPVEVLDVLPILIILKAFSSGCSALTGLEAIANGVQIFKPPESRNAGITMIWMGSLLGTMFIGVTFLANKYGIFPKEHETILSQLGKDIFAGGFFYYLLQFSTCFILVLAANTPFADFPRLCSVMARDGYLPRQLANKGDRLVFSNGIMLLGLIASVLIVIFKGDTHLLIPLYAVGVFLAFTLSQSGMVIHWFRFKGKGWRRSAIINGSGAITTAVALSIIASTKFIHGAWIVVIAIPIIVYITKQINQHYKLVAEQLSLKNIPEEREMGYKEHYVIVPISGVHTASLKAFQYAKTLSNHVRAVYVSINPGDERKVQEKWEEIDAVPLVILQSPYRSILEPLKQYIDKLEEEHPNITITIVVPEFVPYKWWHHLLHNQTGLLISRMLLYKTNVMVVSVPMHLEK